MAAREFHDGAKDGLEALEPFDPDKIHTFSDLLSAMRRTAFGGRRVGEAFYSDSFVAHWLGRLLYFQAPAWVFACAYTVFGAVVVLSWGWVRPRPFGRFRSNVARSNLGDVDSSRES